MYKNPLSSPVRPGYSFGSAVQRPLSQKKFVFRLIRSDTDIFGKVSSWFGNSFPLMLYVYRKGVIAWKSRASNCSARKNFVPLSAPAGKVRSKLRQTVNALTVRSATGLKGILMCMCLISSLLRTNLKSLWMTCLYLCHFQTSENSPPVPHPQQNHAAAGRVHDSAGGSAWHF